MQLKVEESYVKMQIINALLSLMEKNTFNEITITQIVQTAHVGRASFYRNYKDKEDVIQKHMSFLCHRWEIEFKETNSPNNLVGSLLRHYYLERKFYQQLYKSGLSHYILDSIRQACKIEEQSNNKPELFMIIQDYLPAEKKLAKAILVTPLTLFCEMATPQYL